MARPLAVARDGCERRSGVARCLVAGGSPQRRCLDLPGQQRPLVGLGLALLNFTFDEIANPQLRSGPALSRWLKLTRMRRRELAA